MYALSPYTARQLQRSASTATAIEQFSFCASLSFAPSKAHTFSSRIGQFDFAEKQTVATNLRLVKEFLCP